MVQNSQNKVKEKLTRTQKRIIKLSILFIVIYVMFGIDKIPSASMSNTLLINEIIFIKYYSYGITNPTFPFSDLKILPFLKAKLTKDKRPKRGDVLIIRRGQNRYIRRCIAIEGDFIMQKDKHIYLRPIDGDTYIFENFHRNKLIEIGGAIWVKDPFENTYTGIWHDNEVINDGSVDKALFDITPRQIEGNEYFVLSDNRDHFSDSRFWGNVKYNEIEGSISRIIFSIDDNYSIRWNRMFKTLSEIDELVLQEHNNSNKIK